MNRKGLLVSQIGYDTRCPMRAVYRSSQPDSIQDGSFFKVHRKGENEALISGKAIYWGSCWDSHWWTMDLSGLEAGEYSMELLDADSNLIQDASFKVGNFLLWDSTIPCAVIDQLEERAERAKCQSGWKDCGSNLREACSHAATIIGLCEFACISVDWVSSKDYQRLIKQIIQGCKYLCSCQDKADMLGLPKGSFVHEIVTSPHIVLSDTSQCALALAYSSRLIFDSYPDLSKDFLQRAKNAREFINNLEPPYESLHYSADNHGAPEDFDPSGELMTRELLVRAWLDFELWISGRDNRYKEGAIQLAEQVLSRQVDQADPEDGLYGHFRTYSNSTFTEKANIHHHVGHDTGGIFPYLLLPLIRMAKEWAEAPEAVKWRQAVLDFGNGYLIPACRSNPFMLLPSGYFEGEGILTFCGPWHGINVSYTWISVIATELEGLTGDSVFREIATANVQWLAGLNSGLHAGMFDSSVIFKADIPEGEVHPYSMIEGIGDKHVYGWSNIKGSIVNGFSVNPQFQMTVLSKKENDGPKEFTDEDWIPPVGGWAAALAHLRQTQMFRDGLIQ